jgi:hypothetical protein
MVTMTNVTRGGMAILTVAKGGLMYEASVGGQKFKIEEKYSS